MLSPPSTASVPICFHSHQDIPFYFSSRKQTRIYRYNNKIKYNMVRQIQTKKIRVKVTIKRKRYQENSKEKVIDTEK